MEGLKLKTRRVRNTSEQWDYVQAYTYILIQDPLSDEKYHLHHHGTESHFVLESLSVSSQKPVTGLYAVPVQSSPQSYSVSSAYVIIGTSIYA